MATATKKALELPKEAFIAQVYDESEYDPTSRMFLISVSEPHPFLKVSTPVFGSGESTIIMDYFDNKKPLPLKGLTVETKVGSDGKERLWLCIAE